MNDKYDGAGSAELRLRAADPAGPSRPLPPPRVTRAELIEDIMTTTEEMPDAPAGAPRPARTRWLLAAAAAVVAAAVGITVAVTAGGSSSQPKTVKHLAMAGGDSMSMCIQFSVDVLRDMPVAFSGTATEVTDDTALLDVDHWYKGGSADQVEVANNNSVGVTLEGGIQFEVGTRYLITASDGTVSMCGYSGEWSPEFEQSFDEAFGS